MSPQEREDFITKIWGYYNANGRHDLPWRLPESDGTFDPYKIMVSELMLQQTQVPRVVPKYTAFLEQFPDVETLACASLGEVLRVWQGLGYNRRAKFLWQAAGMIRDGFGGELPRSQAELTKLPGVGVNTAGAIMAYAFNEPVLFIETNIRTVYIYHFFRRADQGADEQAFADAQVLEKLNETLPPDNPREFYWALMDYGTQIKQDGHKLNMLTKGYIKQSRFNGSRRQLRGQALRILASSQQPIDALQVMLPDPRLAQVLDELQKEGLVRQANGKYFL